MVALQYFVFDQKGQKILEASAIPCENDKELQDLADTMVSNFKTNPVFKNTQLILSCGSEIIFSSTAQ